MAKLSYPVGHKLRNSETGELGKVILCTPLGQHIERYALVAVIDLEGRPIRDGVFDKRSFWPFKECFSA